MSRTLSRASFLVLLAAAFGLLFAPGEAKAYRFGTGETINRIEDIKLKGAKDEALFLGYMTRIRYFLAGLYVEDVGYVLGVQGDSKRFYHMPEGDELKSFQQRGLLPSPLPPYKLSAFDYIIGYSLWWGLVVVAIIVVWSDRRRRAAAAADQTMPSTPGTPSTPDTPGTPPSPAA